MTNEKTICEELNKEFGLKLKQISEKTREDGVLRRAKIGKLIKGESLSYEGEYKGTKGQIELPVEYGDGKKVSEYFSVVATNTNQEQLLPIENIMVATNAGAETICEIGDDDTLKCADFIGRVRDPDNEGEYDDFIKTKWGKVSSGKLNADFKKLISKWGVDFCEVKL